MFDLSADGPQSADDLTSVKLANAGEAFDRAISDLVLTRIIHSLGVKSGPDLLEYYQNGRYAGLAEKELRERYIEFCRAPIESLATLDHAERQQTLRRIVTAYGAQALYHRADFELNQTDDTLDRYLVARNRQLTYLSQMDFSNSDNLGMVRNWTNQAALDFFDHAGAYAELRLLDMRDSSQLYLHALACAAWQIVASIPLTVAAESTWKGFIVWTDMLSGLLAESAKTWTPDFAERVNQGLDRYLERSVARLEKIDSFSDYDKKANPTGLVTARSAAHALTALFTDLYMREVPFNPQLHLRVENKLRELEEK